jgi:prefoldin subunit 5
VAQTQVRVDEAQERADSRIAELAQSQKRTGEMLAEGNERMNSLILVVERYFSNGRGEPIVWARCRI